jgi:hypothetical protein
MKYTLVVGLTYKKYRKPATVTLSLDNNFIDQFSLDRDYGSVDVPGSMIHDEWYNYDFMKNMKGFYKLSRAKNDPVLTEKHFSMVDHPNSDLHRKFSLKWPNFTKVYKIEEKTLKGVLKIDVNNDNSDFTNGFIKNSSLIQFPVIALFPTNMCANNGEKLMEFMIKTELKAFYADDADGTKAGNFFSMDAEQVVGVSPVVDRIRHTWPCADSFFLRRKSDAHEKSEALYNGNDHPQYIGGSFTAEFPIMTKHKVHYFKSFINDAKGFFSPAGLGLLVGSYKPLLNIYNEDQRNSN